jgi:hypothetical protein
MEEVCYFESSGSLQMTALHRREAGVGAVVRLLQDGSFASWKVREAFRRQAAGVKGWHGLLPRYGLSVSRS